MNGPIRTHRPATAWRGAARAALWLYPRPVRARHGGAMLETFDDAVTAARRHGRRPFLAALAELADLVRNGALQRLGGGSISRSPQQRFRRQRDMIGTLMADTRYAWRALRQRPGFTIVVVLILAVGIGASTAMFSVFDSAVLNPMPFRDADRIVELWRVLDGGGRVTSWQQEEVAFWRDAGVLEQIVGWDAEEVDLTGIGDPRALMVGRVDPELLSFLGVRPRAGRDLLAEEGLAGAEPVALVSAALAGQLAGDPVDAVGESVELDGVAHRVVGVMPSGFTFPFQGVEAWIPVAFVGEASRMPELRPRLYGRLRTGEEIAVATERGQARADAAAVDTRLALFRPSDMWDDTREALLLLLAGVGLLLLSACANTANLLLASATDRQREAALRSALGAGRGRLVRQAMIESLLLAAGGAVLGTGVARALLAAVMDVAPRQVAYFTANAVDVDPRALAFTLLLALATALLFGTLPAWRGSRQRPAAALAGGRGATDAANRRLRHGLVVAEVALAVVLLVGAALLSGSLLQLVGSDLGHDTEGIYTLTLRPSSTRYPTAAGQADLMARVTASVARIPGVERATFASGLPIDGVDSFSFDIQPEGEGEPLDETDADVILPTIRVAAGYFETLGIPLLQGRDFTDQEVRDGAPVVILSESMARRYFPSGQPIGKGFRMDAESPWRTVVGVAGEVRTMGVEEPLGPMELYGPIETEDKLYRASVIFRAPRAAADLADAVRAAVAAADPLQPIEAFHSADRVLWNQLNTQRFYLSLAATFGLAAMVLAVLGIYGVISYTVSQRTREIGIRVALGARRQDVRALVLRLGLALGLAGVTVGLVAAFAISGALDAYLYEITSTDPRVFALVGVGMLGLALLATWVPARRALRVDPMEALRAD